MHGIVGSSTSTGRSPAIAASPVDAPAKERAADGAPALQHRALALEVLISRWRCCFSIDRSINPPQRRPPSFTTQRNLAHVFLSSACPRLRACCGHTRSSAHESFKRGREKWSQHISSIHPSIHPFLLIHLACLSHSRGLCEWRLDYILSPLFHSFCMQSEWILTSNFPCDSNWVHGSLGHCSYNQACHHVSSISMVVV